MLHGLQVKQILQNVEVIDKTLADSSRTKAISSKTCGSFCLLVKFIHFFWDKSLNTHPEHNDYEI